MPDHGPALTPAKRRSQCRLPLTRRRELHPGDRVSVIAALPPGVCPASDTLAGRMGLYFSGIKLESKELHFSEGKARMLPRGTGRDPFFTACWVLAVFAVSAASPAFAETSSKSFVLKDGSVVQAEILSFSNGVYQLRSKSLGRFSLSEEKIHSIQYGDNRGVASASGNPSLSDLGIDARQMEQMKNRMLSDPETAKLLQNLQKDPAVRNILNDKELMDAVNQGDVGKVAADPKVKGLMNNKEVGKILERAR
ncbi:MAG: hypothetical protein HY579_01090 [Nitrospinae bacterium]|nr:hypothetical protein [Nitrospinota bacterium]